MALIFEAKVERTGSSDIRVLHGLSEDFGPGTDRRDPSAYCDLTKLTKSS